MKRLLIALLGLSYLVLISCTTVNTEKPEVPVFTKQVDVFGIHLYATPTAPDEKLLHAANVLAEYLDNDEDGIPDDQSVVNALVEKKAILIMTKDSGDEWEAIHEDLHYAFPDGVYHDNFANEARPNAIENRIFDGLWEETLHLLTRHGWGNAYPLVFAPVPGSKVAAAVDLARGGHYKDAPEQYPEDSWYNYYDESCRYGCQIDEYMYWTITSILGAQNLPGRAEQMSNEWPLNTKEKVRDGDPTVYALLTDPQYSIPTVLPDGSYQAKTFPIEEIRLEIKVQEENYFPPEGRYPATVRFITESQAPGGEAIKIAFTITDENEHAGKSLCFMTSTVFTFESELFSIITEIKPELKDVQSVDEIDTKIIEGERVWLTTEPMVGITGSVFPKVVSIERMED